MNVMKMERLKIGEVDGAPDVVRGISMFGRIGGFECDRDGNADGNADGNIDADGN